MSWTDRRAHWEQLAKEIDPAIRLHTKRSWVWKLYGNDNISSVSSVIGPHMFIPERHDDIEHEVYHEGRHIRQQRWFGLGIHPWVGLIPFALVSIFLLPVLFTIRFWLELDAETYALRRKVATGSSVVYAQAELLDFAVTLSSAMYLWAWPRKWAVAIAKKRRF